MIFISNANGTIVKKIGTDDIHQGSVKANEIVLLAPYLGATQLNYKLPNGVLGTQEMTILSNTSTKEINTSTKEIIGVGETKYYGYYTLLTGAVAQYPGNITLTFQTSVGKETAEEELYQILTDSVNITINKGLVSNNNIGDDYAQHKADVEAETAAREKAIKRVTPVYDASTDAIKLSYNDDNGAEHASTGASLQSKLNKKGLVHWQAYGNKHCTELANEAYRYREYTEGEVPAFTRGDPYTILGVDKISVCQYRPKGASEQWWIDEDNREDEDSYNSADVTGEIIRLNKWGFHKFYSGENEPMGAHEFVMNENGFTYADCERDQNTGYVGAIEDTYKYLKFPLEDLLGENKPTTLILATKNDVSGEAAAREKADSELSTSISAETTARKAAIKEALENIKLEYDTKSHEIKLTASYEGTTYDKSIDLVLESLITKVEDYVDENGTPLIKFTFSSGQSTAYALDDLTNLKAYKDEIAKKLNKEKLGHYRAYNQDWKKYGVPEDEVVYELSNKACEGENGFVKDAPYTVFGVDKLSVCKYRPKSENEEGYDPDSLTGEVSKVSEYGFTKYYAKGNKMARFDENGFLFSSVIRNEDGTLSTGDEQDWLYFPNAPDTPDGATVIATNKSISSALNSFGEDYDEKLNGLDLVYDSTTQRLNICQADGTTSEGVEILDVTAYKELARKVELMFKNTADFVTEETYGYEMNVPTNALPYAEVRRIGGMTYKSNNLIPFPYKSKSGTYAGDVTFTVNADGSVTVNGDATDHGAFFFFDVMKNENREGSLPLYGDYTLSGISDGSDTTYKIFPWVDYVEDFVLEPTFDSKTYTLNGNLIAIVFEYEAGAHFDNFVIKPMLNKGSKALQYEPPGLNDIKVMELRCCTVENYIPRDYYNKVEKKYGVTYTVSDNGTIVANGTSTDSGYFVLCHELHLPAGKEFTLSGCPAGGSESTYCLYVTERDVYTNEWEAGYADIGEGKPFTTRENTYYEVSIRISLIGLMLDNITFKPMLNIGNTALPYQPPKEVGTFAIPEELRNYLEQFGYGKGVSNEYYNYIDFDNKCFVQNVCGKVFDGTEDWVVGGSNQNLMRLNCGDNAHLKPCLSNALTGSTKAPNNLAEGEFCTVISESSSDIYVRLESVTNPNGTTANDDKISNFKTWLDKNPVKIEYVLATPNRISIPDDVVSDNFWDDNFIKVSDGGIITAVNEVEYEYKVPITIEYQKEIVE